MLAGFSVIRARRFFWVLAVFSVLALAFALPTAAFAKANPRYASIVMDSDTGQILSQSGADKQLHPASLTKVMTLLLAFEALDQGKLGIKDRISISKHAANMAPSKLGLQPGSTIKVQDAIYAIVTKSANDISAAMGERLGGTESNFARMMTAKAREIGMTRTTFKNASGLHDPAQITTARDMATLARYVITRYPTYYRYFSTANFTYQGKNYHNHNRLMATYKGMDGMKTGYVNASGFNLVASAVRNDRRLIGVVFGGRTTQSRNSHMAALLDSGFERIKGTKAPEVVIASVDAKSPAEIAPAAGVSAVAMTRGNAPLPPRKPALLVALNSFKTNVTATNTPPQPQVKMASLNPAIDTTRFNELLGEGDSDPAQTDRIETGLIAVSAVKGQELNAGTLTRPMPETAIADEPWAIQIGAFTSRAATDKAIHNSLKKLPAQYTNANPAIAPLKTADGWLFRARLTGYSRDDAFRACKYLSSCMPVAPRN